MTQSTLTGAGGSINGLRQVFPAGEIFLVSDDESIQAAAAEYGMTGYPLDAGKDLPEGANVLLVLRNELVSRTMRKAFTSARVLVVPVASFDPSLEACLYTLNLAVHSDYAAMCELNRYWTTNVANATGPLVFEGRKPSSGDPAARTSLACTFGAEIEANAWFDAALDAGQWVSVGSYCEFSMTAPSSKDWCGRFTVNGTAAASGVVIAKDARCESVGEERIQRAHQLHGELVSRAPIILNVHDGQVTSVRAGGEDFTAAVREVTNPEYELHALELGIGTNLSLLPRVDWSYNSQMNEGAGLVHLGIGEGITGAHMDFVVADGEHRFV